MIRQSEQIEALSDAFAKAQMKFGAAIKASQNPAFRSKYADLASVIEATLEHLNAEGIGVMQHPALDYKPAGDGVEAFVTVTTRLQHKSGQWMESDVSLPAVMRERFDAQSVGSAITYACRYALRSICTVPQADDDANAASGVGSSEAAKSVGEAKIAKLKEKAGKSPANGPQMPITTLFWTAPDKYNGHRAVFMNLKEYGAGLNEVAAEGLRAVLKKYVKYTGNEMWVPTSGENNFDMLLVDLEACGVPTKKLGAAE
jgi:hypothetical protein